MSQIANTGRRGRTLLLLGIAAAVVAVAVFRVRLGTVLYFGAFLALPFLFLALPFLMMRMHGGGHGSGHGGGFGCGGGHRGSSERDDATRDPGEAPTTHQH